MQAVRSTATQEDGGVGGADGKEKGGALPPAGGAGAAGPNASGGALSNNKRGGSSKRPFSLLSALAPPVPPTEDPDVQWAETPINGQDAHAGDIPAFGFRLREVRGGGFLTSVIVSYRYHSL